jgi:L-fuconate dehydratase
VSTVPVTGGQFTHFSVHDVRFPTSLDKDGSDALNADPDYSTAYVVVHTSAGDRGHGFVFTIGRGTEVAVAAIRAVERLVVGLSVDDVLADLGGFWRRLVHDSHLRWLGPEKGVMHMGIGAVVNAVWDLYARRQGLPLWQALSRMTPEQLVDLVDFRHLSDAIDRAEALDILQRAAVGREAREAALQAEGYPAYTTSAGWLGYSDEKVARLVSEALGDGFDHIKLKVGLDVAEDVRRLALVRELVGPDVKLSVDANQAWERDEAIAWVAALAPHGVYWVEEPTSPDDVLAHAAIVRAVHPIKVATGEHVANRVMFKQLMAAGALGVCQIDACRVAGVNENVAILLLAAKFGVPVCPHAGGVGLCEVVQHLSMFDYVAVSGTMEERWVEFVDHLHEHFESPVRIVNARYQAPLTPGNGAAMLPGSVREFAFPDGPAWSLAGGR